MALATLGAYLERDDPLGQLWPDLVSTAFLDGPRDEDLAHLSSAARTLYLVGVLIGEVCGGGLSSFFSNSSGNHVPETFDALEALGAEAAAGLLREALIPFDGELPPRDRVARCDALFAFEEREPDALLALDARFDGVEAELWELQRSYLRAHAASPLRAG